MAKRNLEEWVRLINELKAKARESGGFIKMDFTNVRHKSASEYMREQMGKMHDRTIPKWEDRWEWPKFEHMHDATTDQLHNHMADVDRAARFEGALHQFYYGSSIKVDFCTTSKLILLTRTMSARISRMASGPWVKDLHHIDSRPRWHTLDVDYD